MYIHIYISDSYSYSSSRYVSTLPFARPVTSKWNVCFMVPTPFFFPGVLATVNVFSTDKLYTTELPNVTYPDNEGMHITVVPVPVYQVPGTSYLIYCTW